MEQSTAVHTKVPVVVRDDYVMYLELAHNSLWFHTDVAKWTPEVKTKFVENLNQLQELVNIPLLALIEETNTKLSKFAKTIDFQYLNTLVENNETYHIYSRGL
jgi:hypothetical protein